MSKWRPAPSCIYVMGDIHGNYKALVRILNRILPLRDEDEIVFLGDYIDRGPDSAKVVDALMKLLAKYPEQVTCLMGNHEWVMLAALGVTHPNTPTEMSPAEVWLRNGGQKTIVSYATMAKTDLKSALSIPLHRVRSLIPPAHLKFLVNTYQFYELGTDIFVHAAIDPAQPLDNQHPDVLLWDRSLYKLALKHINAGLDMPWDNRIICGHSYNGPVIHPKYMMLDSSGQGKLLCAELNSMEGFYAVAGQSRMVKADLGNTTKPPGTIFKGKFRRIS